MAADIDWSSGQPRSRLYDDIYFSPDDGLAEARAVFLAGCGLPDGWAGRERFVVGELGFGTGLNVLALLAMWRAARPSPTARLNILSVEAHPLAPPDAARALAAWPELAALARPLLERWPRGRRGPHRFDWPELGATLDLRVDEVGPALAGWSGRADAWFLDGFAPARNPAMWTHEVLAAVAGHASPGARAATFTVAGSVRHGLEAAGFAIVRRPGHGAKRERLEARLPATSARPEPPRAPRVAVIGGGVAGAALVRALAGEGLAPWLVEADAIGAGASGNAAALVSPRLDAGLNAQARLHAHAFARAVDLVNAEAPEAVITRGALQLARRPGDADRFARLAAWDGFDPRALVGLDAATTAARLGEVSASEALELRDALVLDPRDLLERWIGDAPRIPGHVAELVPDRSGWRLLDCAETELVQADVVCLALGAGLPTFLPAAALRSTRGQVEVARLALDVAPAAWGGYAIPSRDGILYGATHVRGDRDVGVRAAERAANLATLAATLPVRAERVRSAPTVSRAGVRLATPDHTPIAAETDAPGVFVLGALGGRGFTLAPLLAEHLAATIAGAPSSLTVEAQRLVGRTCTLARQSVSSSS